MKKLLAEICAIALLVALAGCSDEIPGEQRGRLGGNGSGGSRVTTGGQPQNYFEYLRTLRPPPGFQPRSQSFRFNPELRRQQFERRRQMGVFNRANLPLATPIQRVRISTELSAQVATLDGNRYQFQTMCMQVQTSIANDARGVSYVEPLADNSEVRVRNTPCPVDGAFMGRSEIALRAKRIPYGHGGNPNVLVELSHNGKVVGHMIGQPSFAQWPSGSTFPNGFKIYTLINFCTDIDYSRTTQIRNPDFIKNCEDAGLIS